MKSTTRLGLYYSALFFTVGMVSPYMPLWFAAQGLSGAQIGVILAAPLLARTVTAPTLAIWADGFALRRTPLVIMGAGAVLAYAAYVISHGFWAWATLWFVSQTLFATLAPLADVIALRRSSLEGFNFGLPRGLGSAAFVIANVGMGLVLTIAPIDTLIFAVTLASVITAVGARLLLPADRVHEAGEHRGRRDQLAGLWGLIKDPVFMVAVASVGLIQASHAFYYGFGNLAWARQGVPHALFGVLWAVGVIFEIAFFWFLEPWRRRIGPERLIILGGLAGVVRWSVLAFSPPLWLIFPIQALHALTYAACFFGGLQLVQRLSPPAVREAKALALRTEPDLDPERSRALDDQRVAR